MKNIIKITTLFLVLAVAAFGQASLSSTTLGAAITSNTQTSLTLGSTSTMLSQGTFNQPQTVLYVDKEFMWVNSVVDSTHVTVIRAKGLGAGGRPALHNNGARVYYANTTSSAPAASYFLNGSASGDSSEPSGSCTATNELVLPRFVLFTANGYNCFASQWALTNKGSMLAEGQAISAFCTGSLGSAETEYLNSAACSGATSATAAYVVQAPGVLGNLRVNAGTNVSGGTNKDVLTVYQNGNASVITCTFATGGAATTCSDTTHGVIVSPGDVITFQFVTATSDTGANIRASVGLY